MRAIIFWLLVLFFGQTDAQTLKSVSNADNDLKKHQQILASRLLSWSTGSEEQIDYVSVGRYANYFGFVKLRVSSDHSLKRSEVGRETLSVLTEPQRETLFGLLDEQTPLVKSTHSARLQANDFLQELLNGNRSYSDRDGFIELAQLYAVIEAELGVFLANEFAKIIDTLTPQQKNQLTEVRKKHTSGVASKVNFYPESLKALSQKQKQEIFNLAARFLSWTTGDLEDFAYETIGKPSQHFGFVSLRIDSNHGVKRGVVADEVIAQLTDNQRTMLETASTRDATNLKLYLSAREKFLEALAALREIDFDDVSELSVLATAMANLEANMSWYQAVAMKQILNTLTPEQMGKLIDLRNKYSPSQNSSGAELYHQCNSCHQNDQVAPDLTSVVNRKVASSDYKYSPAMSSFAERNKIWTRNLLGQFLTNPQQTVPGTTMSFKGVKDEQLRWSLIEYLENR